jgi:hypothetical protein
MSIVSNHYPELLDECPENLCHRQTRTTCRLPLQTNSDHYAVGFLRRELRQDGTCLVCGKTVPLDDSDRIKLHGPAPESTSAICPGSGAKPRQ